VEKKRHLLLTTVHLQRQQVQALLVVRARSSPWNPILPGAQFRREVLHPLKKVHPLEVVILADLRWVTLEELVPLLVPLPDLMARSTAQVVIPAVSLDSLDPMQERRWAETIPARPEEIYLHRSQRN
jgi:hypothetical protein